jgi:RimJ/RimL family protein N-acetyltransferase
MHARRLRAEWADARGTLAAIEPTPDDVRARASELARAYNDEHNSAMMANTAEFAEDDVLAHYEAMTEEGARQFFLYDGGSFVGDADVRNIANGAGELAILIAPRASQGKGLGTRFAILLHVVAFRALALERLYVTILPENAASLRVFEKIGYRVDTSPEARSYVDDERDVSMSIAKGEFERAHEVARGEIRITEE